MTSMNYGQSKNQVLFYFLRHPTFLPSASRRYTVDDTEHVDGQEPGFGPKKCPEAPAPFLVSVRALQIVANPSANLPKYSPST